MIASISITRYNCCPTIRRAIVVGTRLNCMFCTGIFVIIKVHIRQQIIVGIAFASCALGGVDAEIEEIHRVASRLARLL